MERCKHLNTPKPAAKKQKTSVKSSPNTTGAADDGQPSQDALEIPPGKKKDKQKLR
jgi:hypothetical protein